MNSNSECPTVPPLYTWDSGTVRNKRDSRWDSPGTASLKALALAVLSVPLERDKVGQSVGQRKNTVPRAGEGLGQKTAGVFPHGEEKLSLEKYDSASIPASPRRCLECSMWRSTPGGCWWVGRCAVTGAEMGHKSVCTVPAMGVLQ